MAAMNSLVAGSSMAPGRRTGQLPEISRNEQVYANADQVMIRRYGPRRPGMGMAESGLADLDAVLPEAQAVLDDLHALARPASKLDVAKHLAVLVKCYPKARNADGEIYARMLAGDVAATQPSIGDVEGACRKLRRTLKFCPTIAEVLEALEAATKHRRDVTYMIGSITKSRDQKVREVELECQQLKAEQERQRPQRLEYRRNVQSILLLCRAEGG
jgi:hypothetical protein